MAAGLNYIDYLCSLRVMTEAPELGNDLLRLAARLTRWATRNASLEVPSAQARLLALLDELGPARVSVLADADHCSQPTMTTQLQRVEAEGWAQRVADPGDARASLISLTPKGRTALDQARKARLVALAPAFVDLDDVALQRLRVAVEVLEELLDRAASTTTPHTRKDG
jgi:DNA-binding MarR family transcriptional regulator